MVFFEVLKGFNWCVRMFYRVFAASSPSCTLVPCYTAGGGGVLNLIVI